MLDSISTISDLALPFNPWPSQARSFYELLPSINGRGYCDCPVLTIPTGGGKTRLMVMIAYACKLLGLRLAIYTHRKMLTSQAVETFDDMGVAFGVRAASHEPALFRDVQICAIDTERCRTLTESPSWVLHDADVVIFDEAHEQLHATAQTIASDHISSGCRLLLGLTATPVNCSLLYNRLIVGATKEELRDRSLYSHDPPHVPIKTFAPTEAELHNVRRQKTGEYQVGEVRKAIMTPTIVGSIEEHWRRLNPDARPAILFAPCVDSSIELATKFKARGITARHIDGTTSDSEREDIAGESRDGECKIVCNRFVLRTGVDWPWLYQGIFATIFGGLHNWQQAGGRLQRNDGSTDHKICQDHGGNWHRHCALDDDFDWRLTDTPAIASKRIIGRRKEQTGDDCDEPICCPKCQRIRRAGSPRCPNCGHSHKQSVRTIMQTDGTLERKRGRVTKAKPKATDVQRAWNAAFWAGKKNNRTLNSVRAHFENLAREAGVDPVVPFGPNGGAMLRNCPDRGSVYWGAGVRDYLDAKERGEA